MIEDCHRYDPLTTNNNIWTPNSAVITYSNDGMYVSQGNWSQFNLIDALQQGHSLEFDCNYITGTLYTFYATGSGGTAGTYSTEQRFTQTGHYKITLENDVLTWYKDNVQIYTQSWNQTTSYWWLWTGDNGKFTLKNLKLKSL